MHMSRACACHVLAWEAVECQPEAECTYQPRASRACPLTLTLTPTPNPDPNPSPSPGP
jgi:hypothetical protein